jgi:hypothetical protein
MARKPLTMFLRISVLLSKYRSTGAAVLADGMEVFSVVPLPDRCFEVSAVMHTRHA